jgi:hypothetical protein
VYSYICYGLSIRSTLPLPELERAGSRELGAGEQRAKRKGQSAGSKELTSDLRPLISDLWHQAGSKEQKSKGQRAKGKAQRGKNREQGAGSGELGISDCGFRIADLGNRQERGAGSEKHGAWSLEHGAESLEGVADVEIRFGRVDRLPSGVGVEGSYFRAIPDETQLFWEDVVTIRIRGGREITIDPVPGVQEDLLRHLILGPALGALLQQRGLLVLHASAVAIDDGAVAFLGGKGWGKSSLAGAFYPRGHGIVSDDVTAVHVGTGCPRVLSGFPQLKLWPDTAASLGNMEELPELYSGAIKLTQRVDRGFSQTPLPLRCIYVLAQGKAKKVEPLVAGKAFLELVRHSYRTELLQARGASAHFLQCASVTKSTSIRYLRIPRSLSILPDIARLVEEDIAYHKSEHSGSSPTP